MTAYYTVIRPPQDAIPDSDAWLQYEAGLLRQVYEFNLAGFGSRATLTLIRVYEEIRPSRRHNWVRQKPYYSSDPADDWRERDTYAPAPNAIPEDVWAEAERLLLASLRHAIPPGNHALRRWAERNLITPTNPRIADDA